MSLQQKLQQTRIRGWILYPPMTFPIISILIGLMFGFKFFLYSYFIGCGIFITALGFILWSDVIQFKLNKK